MKTKKMILSVVIALAGSAFANSVDLSQYKTPDEPATPPQKGGGVDQGGGIEPVASAAQNTAAIQDAIDAAANLSEPGTVTLGSGIFEIDSQLMVTGGVTLVGQGWESTIIKQTAVGSNARCATVRDGSKIERLTLTGGHIRATWQNGAGVDVENGIVSWCCITNNQIGDATWQSVTVNNATGAGVRIKEGSIDHSIVSFNTSYMNGGGVSHGGGISVDQPTGLVLIDTCLITGNRAPNGNGGGIYASFGNYHNRLTVRSTTIVGNEATGTGGGAFVDQNISGQKYDFALVDSIIADNVSGSGDANLGLSAYASTLVNGYAAQSSANLFANGTAMLGEGSQSFDGGGAEWFVDVSGNDCHLSSTSPAVSAGGAYEGIGIDLDGVAFANPPSIGCYESRDMTASPTFDPAPDSTFYPSTYVTLSCETAGAAIYYTTDGSTPTVSSTLYTAPLEMSATTTIRARAYAQGFIASGIVSATYTRKKPTPRPKDFKKRVEITLKESLSETEIASGIPALIRLGTSISGFRYSDFSLANGEDMMFVDESGTPLPHEVDSWDTAGESLVWVRLPSTAANTKVVMYYGYGAVSPEEPSDVWGDDYVGVWHFGEATAATAANSQGTYANSTATEGIDGNIAQYAVTNETGRFGKCFRANDSTYRKTGNYACGGVWVNDSGEGSHVDGGKNFTISGWFKHDSFDYYWDHIFYKRQKSDNTASPNNAFAIECNSTTAAPNPLARGSAGGGTQRTLSNSLLGTWGHLTFVFDGGTCHVYENGVSVGDSGITACIDNDSPLVFGNNCDIASGLAGDCAWNGWIDEVRYSSGSKSAEWVAAEYKAMNVGETDIFAFGDIERVGASEFVITVR